MKSRARQIILFVLLASVIFAGGYAIGQSSAAPVHLFGPVVPIPGGSEESIHLFLETWQLTAEKYFDQPLDEEALIEGAIEGMLATLDDPNTRYLSPDQEQAARESQRGSIEGIGAEVTEQEGDIVIVAPFEGSPAEAAGLESGDILRQADGIDLAGMSVFEAATLIRGPAGTEVELLIERAGQLIELSVTRDTIRVPSVRGEVLDEDLAYLRLSRFGNQTAQEVEDTLTELLSEQPDGLILDLRGNPGGNLNTVVDVADQFLAEGSILVQRYGDGREKRYDSDDDGLAQQIPLAVLIDEGSASASEVLAGAIQDRGRGVLVGASSFGKGTVQEWERLSNGGGLRLTVARWLTPNGAWVHETGLEPDLALPLTDSDDSPDAALEDKQLELAIDYLLGRTLTSTPQENSEAPGETNDSRMGNKSPRVAIE